ncbi:MAG: GGDEF domain-containing protein [Schwartzia sp.]|nr:GGDEF domain-containing protein [Schwartzia sp. (in: firmicutes)]MBO6209758.1 GGDEF domain-containing protein [Schwartzia sp. (in: firmicutes)]
MTIKSVNARFMMVLLPLLALCFVLISGVTYYMASESLSRSAVTVARCLGNEAALRMQISVADIHLPLKVAAAHPDAFLSGNEDAILQELNALKKTSSLIGQTLFAMPNGQTLRADGKHLDRSSRAYFQKVVRTGEPYISKPFLGETTRKMQTMVLQPIFANGELRGVLFASVHLSTLVDKVMADAIFSDETLYITDEDGVVVGCSEHPNMAGHEELMGEGAMDEKLAYALRTAIASEEQTFVSFHAPDGTERFGAVTPFNLAGNRWTIVSSYPIARINGQIRQLLIAVAAVFIIAVLLAFLIVRVFAQTIAAPLNKVAREFQSISGTSDGDDDDNEKDEIGTLEESVEHIRSLHDKSLQLERKASSDELTGLLNRFGFKRKVGEAMKEHEGHSAVLVFADLDHLKHINDRIGHAAGDDAIYVAAHLLRTGFGGDAIIGRVGGDEFVIFLCTEHGNGADAVERTKALMRDYNATSRKPYYVELSIGATSFVCSPEADISALLRKADDCLYEAKQKRRETSIRY